jgi:hypothetical protein
MNAARKESSGRNNRCPKGDKVARAQAVVPMFARQLIRRPSGVHKKAPARGLPIAGVSLAFPFGFRGSEARERPYHPIAVGLAGTGAIRPVIALGKAVAEKHHAHAK